MARITPRLPAGPDRVLPARPNGRPAGGDPLRAAPTRAAAWAARMLPQRRDARRAFFAEKLIWIKSSRGSPRRTKRGGRHA